MFEAKPLPTAASACEGIGSGPAAARTASNGVTEQHFGFDRLADREPISYSQSVLLANISGIHGEFLGDPSHLRLIGKYDLHPPEPAKGRTWCVVGIDHSRPKPHMLEVIRSGSRHGGIKQDKGAEERVGTRVGG